MILLVASLLFLSFVICSLFASVRRRLLFAFGGSSRFLEEYDQSFACMGATQVGGGEPGREEGPRDDRGATGTWSGSSLVRMK